MSIANRRCVSIIIPTMDRPILLTNCLRSLMEQVVDFDLEIVIVDNNPASGITKAVVSEFSGVRYLEEIRRGIAYARNTGICAARGDIIAMTDDDVIAPPNWIAELVVPFQRPEIIVVTGEIKPYQLETEAQRVFELYAGMGRGDQSMEFDAEWMESYWWMLPPLWRIGMTANAAYRASAFRDVRIGLLEEVFGTGTPTGAFEDIYQHYKVLKAGGIIHYQPSAVILHDHRRDMTGLINQLSAYRRGEMAFLVYMLVRHAELRALCDILVRVPVWRLTTLMREIALRMRGEKCIPFKLWLRENAAYLGGPIALMKSIRRVQKMGRTPPLHADVGEPVLQPIQP